MSDRLLQTKLFIPASRAVLIPRPQLINRLNEGLQGKLTLISAPAGYGKTSLVTTWIDQVEEEMRAGICWLSLDREESDPRRFFCYVAAALGPIIGTTGSLPQLLHTPQPPSAKSMMTALINDCATVLHPFCLVLDDYHVVESLEIDQALAFLLDHMPAAMTLIITGRTDPGFPLSRLRVRGDLTEIRVDRLRFTPEEAAHFLQKSMDLELSAEQVAALEARTEGWIAGLQMAALSLQGRADKGAFIEAFAGSHRFVLDYLVEEVLDSQSAEVRQFLLQTAILERVCGPLCDTVTGQSDGHEMLLRLERDNMFVIPLDDARQWYRYHHLFADMLRARLLEAMPDHTSDHHARASEWYEAEGFVPEAIGHALAANAFERAARLIELTWRAMDITFQHNRWLDWARKIPAEMILTRPVLGAGLAWAHLNRGEFEQAEGYLKVAAHGLEGQPGAGENGPLLVADAREFQRLPGSIASAYAYSAQAKGDMTGAIRHAEEALQLLPEDDDLGRAIPRSLLSLARWAGGELDTAYAALAAALAGFERSGNPMAAISGRFALADIRQTQGKLDAAFEIYRQGLKLVEAEGLSDLRGTEVLYLGLSELHRERGEEETAADFRQKAEELGRHSLEPVFHYRYRLALARMHMEAGGYEEGLHQLQLAEEPRDQIFVPDFSPLAAWRARLWLRQGRLRAALDWAAERGLTADDELSFLHEFEHLTLARVLIACYQAEKTPDTLADAEKLLNRLHEAANEGGRIGSLLEIVLLRAELYAAADDSKQAQAALREGLALGEPQGYVRQFITAGEPVIQLLRAINGNVGEHGYVERLLATFEPTVVVPMVEPKLSQALLEPLSERELEVLRLLMTELSGPAIANELMVSLNTFRTHTKNIYTKLGVNSRRSAVNQAQTLDLI